MENISYHYPAMVSLVWVGDILCGEKTSCGWYLLITVWECWYRPMQSLTCRWWGLDDYYRKREVVLCRLWRRGLLLWIDVYQRFLGRSRGSRWLWATRGVSKVRFWENKIQAKSLRQGFKALRISAFLLICALCTLPICDYMLSAYSIHRYPPASMGKYEKIALWSHQYHRWVAVTPPDYAKVFLPTSGY